MGNHGIWLVNDAVALAVVIVRSAPCSCMLCRGAMTGNLASIDVGIEFSEAGRVFFIDGLCHVVTQLIALYAGETHVHGRESRVLCIFNLRLGSGRAPFAHYQWKRVAGSELAIEPWRRPRGA